MLSEAVVMQLVWAIGIILSGVIIQHWKKTVQYVVVVFFVLFLKRPAMYKSVTKM